jgi:hypothetical protein
MALPPTIIPSNILLRRQNGNVPPSGSLVAQLNTTTIIGLSVAGGALLILIICLMIVWVKRKRRKQNVAARNRLGGRKIGDPILVDSTSVGRQGPKYQQSTDSFISTLADMKFDPCVVASDIHSAHEMLTMLHSCRTASHVNYSPSSLPRGGIGPTGPSAFTQENTPQSVAFPTSASEVTSQCSPTTSSHPRSRTNSGEMYGVPRQPIRPHRASNLSKSFSVNGIKPEEELRSRKPSRVGQQPMGAPDNAVRLTSSPLAQVMVPQAGKSEDEHSTPTLSRNRSTVRHPGDANHLRPPKNPESDLAGLQALSFSHPGDILSFHEQQGTIPKPFKPFTFQFPRPAPSPPSVSSVNSGPRPPALTRAENPLAALVSAAGLSNSSLAPASSSPTSPSQFSFNTDLMTYNNHTGGAAHSAANSMDQYRPVDPNSFILSYPTQHSLQAIGGSPLRPEDLESRGIRVGQFKDMNASISSFGTASSDPRAPSWTLETLKENLFAHRRGDSSNGSVSDRSSFNVVDFQFPQATVAGPSGAGPAVRPQSFAINPQNPIEMRTVVQTFQPLLPDELGLRKGEHLGVLRQFDDQWCIVTRETSRSNPGVGGPPGMNGGVLEIGACPAWVFESRWPPEGFTRPMRSSSLGVTVSMRTPATSPVPEPAAPSKPWAMREEVISWSNF